jgi:hypothetical protein
VDLVLLLQGLLYMMMLLRQQLVGILALMLMVTYGFKIVQMQRLDRSMLEVHSLLH